MSKKRVLFVGEHPHSGTGNGNMLRAVLDQLDRSRFDACCFVAKAPAHLSMFNPFKAQDVEIISAEEFNDPWGKRRLLQVVDTLEIDIVAFIGLDIWRYVEIFQALEALRNKKGFKWIYLFPWDLFVPRKDWLSWVNFIQCPYVYSEYGLGQISPEVPKIEYFRPPLRNTELFSPPTAKQKEERRAMFFPDVPPDYTIFGFIGTNQIRKNIPRMVKGFSLAWKKNPKMVLYMHTNPENGIYKLKQLIMDYGADEGAIRFRSPESFLPPEAMSLVYHSLDAYVNFSHQEGLSWTVVEAMLCGLPVLASDSTAHTELISGCGYAVKPTETSFVPLVTSSGPSYVESKACSPEDISEAFLHCCNTDLLKTMSEKCFARAQDWISGVGDINHMLESENQEGRQEQNAILFAQHSSAGDVLMTTAVFKALKERHPDVPLVYMTQEIYWGILKDNPYVDELIPWDGKKLRGYYKYIYSPHSDKILKGGWNQLDITLYEMYWKLTDTEPEEMFIQEEEPSEEVKSLMEGHFLDSIILVQTTGGDPYFRCYESMEKALDPLKGMGLTFVQIGGSKDRPCATADIDLRGKLTWNQSAYLMKRAKAAVVIDSFPSHLAGAVGTPVVVLYGPAPSRVTQPRLQHNSPCINIEPDWVQACPLTTTCWGNANKAQCTTPCINTIEPERVTAALLEVIGKGV